MNKFWIVGTSSKKYINEFMKLLFEGASVGDYLNLDITDRNSPKILLDGEEISSMRSYIVARQRFDVWEGMGFIEKSIKGYKVMFDKSNWEKMVNFTKLSLLDSSESTKVNEFRFTVAISVLVHAGILNEVDIKKLGIGQYKGELTIEKIEKTVSIYEEQLAEDLEFLGKLKDEVNNV